MSLTNSDQMMCDDGVAVVVQAHEISEENLVKCETGVSSLSDGLTLVPAYALPSSSSSVETGQDHTNHIPDKEADKTVAGNEQRCGCVDRQH
jgi:hypothetical protein